MPREVCDLWDGWMRHVDTVSEDPLLLDLAYQALARDAGVGTW